MLDILTHEDLELPVPPRVYQHQTINKTKTAQFSFLHWYQLTSAVPLVKRMIEEENFPNTHSEVESTRSNAGVGSSSQTVVKVYATTAEAIANFKPTHREVISGIAPHVFDERKRRRSQRRASSPSRPYWCNEQVAEKRPSPLRGTSVCAWEVEHSIYLSEQLESATSSKHSYLIPCLNSINILLDEADPQHQETAHENTTTSTNGTIEKINSDNLKTEALWKYLRFDAPIFKLR